MSWWNSSYFYQYSWSIAHRNWVSHTSQPAGGRGVFKKFFSDFTIYFKNPKTRVLLNYCLISRKFSNFPSWSGRRGKYFSLYFLEDLVLESFIQFKNSYLCHKGDKRRFYNAIKSRGWKLCPDEPEARVTIPYSSKNRPHFLMFVIFGMKNVN